MHGAGAWRRKRETPDEGGVAGLAITGKARAINPVLVARRSAKCINADGAKAETGFASGKFTRSWPEKNNAGARPALSNFRIV
jgi:hypothetical protein